jgi:predicted kinase
MEFTKLEDIKPKTKQLFVCRGISGAGKSTLIAKLSIAFLEKKITFTVCSADFFFLRKNGDYDFDVSKLGAAHKHSQSEAKNAMKEGIVSIVIVDNTNLKYWEMKPYVDAAKKYGYEVNILQIHTNIETVLARQVLGKNVPKGTVLKMQQKLEDSDLPKEIIDSTVYIKGE